MKILAISQVYWPDTASVSQHLTDILENLASRGHNVSVISSQRDYENPSIKYADKEIHNSIRIFRISSTGFGKKNKLSRIIDFISFNIALVIKLIYYPSKNLDAIIGLTAPPMVSYIGAKYAKLKAVKFIYWTMDLQPELSIVAGYMKKGGKVANALEIMGDYIFNNSDLIITLDTYMKSHISNRVHIKSNIEIVPVWPVMKEVYDGRREENPFRIDHRFKDKIVVMYSGNHSVMHPITTLLVTAASLIKDKRFLFVHIGGGVRLIEVKDFKASHNLDNIIILPYQPRELIHLSLGAADIQVVCLGDGSVGYTHPNKIYGAMFIGKPILYIGPKESHVTDCINQIEGNISVKHGKAAALTEKLIEFANKSEIERCIIGRNNRNYAENTFSPDVLINKMARKIEKV